MKITDRQIKRLINTVEKYQERKERLRRRRRIERAKQQESQYSRKTRGYYPEWFRAYSTRYYKYLKTDIEKKFEHIIDYTFEEFRDIFNNASCHYCGINENLGLDRKNNNLGHTKSNTLVACKYCNWIRGNRYSIEQMEKIGAVIKTFK